MNTSNDCFVAALKEKLKEQGRGSKKKLAARVSVSPNHLSDILAQRKNAGQKLKERIAHTLTISFEDMLVLGRRIIDGEVDEESGDISGFGFGKGSGGVGVSQDQQSIKTTGFLTMVAAILESNTPYSQALMGNILAYHDAIDIAQKEQKVLQMFNSLHEEMKIMRQDIDELKESEKDGNDSLGTAAA